MGSNYYDNPAISASGLKQIDISPKHYVVEREPSDAMKFGTQAHCAILEPAEFDNRYGIVPDGLDYRTKEGKLVRDGIIAVGKEPIKHADMQDIFIIQHNVHSHPEMIKLMKHNPVFEKEFYMFFNGVAVKMKPDLIIEPCATYPNGFIADLKSTTSAHPEKFAIQMFNNKGYIQPAWYVDLFQRRYNTSAPPPFVWIAAEKKQPHLVEFYECDEHIMEFGRSEYLRLLDIYNDCMETGVWYGYSKREDGFSKLKLPSWAESIISGGGEVEINFVDDEEDV